MSAVRGGPENLCSFCLIRDPRAKTTTPRRAGTTTGGTNQRVPMSLFGEQTAPPSFPQLARACGSWGLWMRAKLHAAAPCIATLSYPATKAEIFESSSGDRGYILLIGVR